MAILNRNFSDKINTTWMVVCLGLVVSIPILLVIGLYFKSSLLLNQHSLHDLLLSDIWKPSDNKFGFYPFIISSIWVTLISIIISAPVCLLTAIYITQYANKKLLKVVHTAIDILSGIPSVIYGVWGILVVVPFISAYIAPLFGIETLGYSILAGALVLSVMIIPFILNILIEIFRAIPDALKEATLSLGATKWQMIKHVLLKKTLPGIIASIGLGVARAFGETMAVLMVVGNVVSIPKNAFDPGYPLPALIANNYGEMLSIPQYESALMFAALILFVVVFIFNALMRFIIVRFEKY